MTLAAFSPSGQPLPKPWNVYAAVAADSAWRLFPLGSLEPGGTRRVSESDLPADFPKDRTPFLFLHPDVLPESTPELFVNGLMDTVPAWRSNIQLRSSTTAVSYQGEYPDTMLPIPKGTLASLCPLIRTGSGVSTKLLLVNIQKRPGREKKKIFLTTLREKRVVAEFEVYTNQCSVVALDGLVSSPENPLCVFSREITGVPIYLSHDKDFRHLSLEHSHPPAELTVFGDEEDRKLIVSRMKKWWLEHVSA